MRRVHTNWSWEVNAPKSRRGTVSRGTRRSRRFGDSWPAVMSKFRTTIGSGRNCGPSSILNGSPGCGIGNIQWVAHLAMKMVGHFRGDPRRHDREQGVMLIRLAQLRSRVGLTAEGPRHHQESGFAAAPRWPGRRAPQGPSRGLFRFNPGLRRPAAAFQALLVKAVFGHSPRTGHHKSQPSPAELTG
jgi:hypothetical protein